MRRVLCDAIIACLALFPIELSHYLGPGFVFWIECGPDFNDGGAVAQCDCHPEQALTAPFPKRNSGAFVFVRHTRSSARSHRITSAGRVWRVFPGGTGRRLRSGRVAPNHEGSSPSPSVRSIKSISL